MNEPRRQLSAVPGLKRTEDLPGPPPRRPILEPSEASLPPASTPPAGEEPETERSTRPPRPRQGGKARAGRSQDADIIRAISVSLPVSLAQEIKERAKVTSTTHADLLMDAVVAHHGHLDELINQVKPAAEVDALFVRTPSRAPVEAYTALSLRMRSANVEVLDALVAKHGAQSRSQLCVAVLTAHLRA